MATLETSGDDVKHLSPPLIDVALYLRGDAIDPVLITNSLGVDPSKAHTKGAKRRIASGAELISKTGLWELTSEEQSTSVSKHLSWIQERIRYSDKSLLSLPGVTDAELNVFIALGIQKDGAETYETALSVAQLSWLSTIGASLSISVIYVED